MRRPKNWFDRFLMLLPVRRDTEWWYVGLAPSFSPAKFDSNLARFETCERARIWLSQKENKITYYICIIHHNSHQCMTRHQAITATLMYVSVCVCPSQQRYFSLLILSVFSSMSKKGKPLTLISYNVCVRLICSRTRLLQRKVTMKRTDSAKERTMIAPLILLCGHESKWFFFFDEKRSRYIDFCLNNV